jgi:hypothetical protein
MKEIGGIAIVAYENGVIVDIAEKSVFEIKAGYLDLFTCELLLKQIKENRNIEIRVLKLKKVEVKGENYVRT